MQELKSGLEGVLVALTRLSDVDGERGRLVLVGHAVEELASRATFEEATALFLGVESTWVRAHLGAARVRAHETLLSLGDVVTRLHHGDCMEALRTVAALPATGQARTLPEEALDVAALLAVTLSSWARAQAGLAPVAPDAALSHAHDVLRMVRGVAVQDAEAHALDSYLVTVMDHGMNASTFAARVVASTGSDLRSCLTAGIGALKGPLHGGAPGPVLDMLDAVASSPGANARAWVDAALHKGERIMGMGHRIYRVRDPRAEVLEHALETLAPHLHGNTLSRLALARDVEKAATDALAARHPDRPLKANVEFYTAVLLEALGLPRTVFASTFACARVIGWCAHVAEQRATGRLIRPASQYIGETPKAA